MEYKYLVLQSFFLLQKKIFLRAIIVVMWIPDYSDGFFAVLSSSFAKNRLWGNENVCNLFNFFFIPINSKHLLRCIFFLHSFIELNFSVFTYQYRIHTTQLLLRNVKFPIFDFVFCFLSFYGYSFCERLKRQFLAISIHCILSSYRIRLQHMHKWYNTIKHHNHQQQPHNQQNAKGEIIF